MLTTIIRTITPTHRFDCTIILQFWQSQASGVPTVSKTSMHGKSAVDGERLSGNESRIVRHQERDDAVDVIRHQLALQELFLRVVVSALLRDSLGCLADGQPRQQAIDADHPLAKLTRERAGHADNGGLAGDIVEQARGAPVNRIDRKSTR